MNNFTYKKIIPFFSPGLILWFLALLTGCQAVGPDYRKPEIMPLEFWNTPLQRGLVKGQENPVEIADWWKTLNDDLLSDLIQRAVSSNLDMKLAVERVREARAKRGIEGAAQFPSLDSSATYSKSRTSDEYDAGTTRENWAAGFDAGWEIDLFGGIRRSIEAADATLQGTRENLRDVLVSLVAEVAQSYVEVRTYQARLADVKRSIDSQTQTWQLTRWRYEAGLTDELAVRQAGYNLESSRSQIPGLESRLEASMNRIAVLLGERPGKLHDELKKVEPIPSLPRTVAVGLPADALRRRPDIRKAETELIAQTARVGVATAELYPKLQLSGSIGIEGLTGHRLVSNLTTPANWLRQAGVRISWNLFDAGAVRRNIEVQSSLQKQALIEYEAAILDAVEEVENALVDYASEQRKNDNLAKAIREAKAAARLAKNKYESGLTDFTTVLESERTLLSFRNQLAESKGTMVSNLIRLYKALGGGWPSYKESLAAGVL